MGKKLTFEEVKNYIESKGHVLLDNVYINDHTHLNLKCPMGHIYSIILNSFKNGRRCRICKGMEATKRQRTPYETVLKKVNEIGRKLLTTKKEYEDSYSKENKFFVIECICGNPHKTALDRIKKKCLCKKCANKKIGERCRTSFEKLKKVVESKGFTLISTSYENDSIDINLICDKGHPFPATFADIKRKGSGCPDCKSDKMSERYRTPYLELLETTNKMNIQVLMPQEIYDQNFKKESKKILVKCKVCEHRFTTTAGRLNFGFGCRQCGNKESADKRRMSYEKVQKTIEDAGYRLITKEYIKFSQKLEILCLKHGIFEATLNSIKSGHRCRDCSHTSPKAQRGIYDFIKSFYPDAINNAKQIIPPLELDIYVPSLNLAIEYCGLYWHSEEYKDNNYHVTKMKLCNEKGIRLITIFEDEWLQREKQVKNFLLSVINKNEIIVMGRKTELKQVSKEEASVFLEENHIQGSPLFEIAFGLYYNNELVGITTGNRHHRQGHNKLFVLNRLAFKSNTSVSGGSSKLLKALIQYARGKGYFKLISWSDNRWSEGNVYQKIGFGLVEELSPDYSYVQKQTRISKQSCQKKSLLKRGATGNTEHEMARSLGFYRIYDCGKKRWEINLS